jgi:hypothetical protein
VLHYAGEVLPERERDKPSFHFRGETLAELRQRLVKVIPQCRLHLVGKLQEVGDSGSRSAPRFVTGVIHDAVRRVAQLLDQIPSG